MFNGNNNNQERPYRRRYFITNELLVRILRSLLRIQTVDILIIEL